MKSKALNERKGCQPPLSFATLRCRGFGLPVLGHVLPAGPDLLAAAPVAPRGPPLLRVALCLVDPRLLLFGAGVPLRGLPVHVLPGGGARVDPVVINVAIAVAPVAPAFLPLGITDPIRHDVDVGVVD